MRLYQFNLNNKAGQLALKRAFWFLYERKIYENRDFPVYHQRFSHTSMKSTRISIILLLINVVACQSNQPAAITSDMATKPMPTAATDKTMDSLRQPPDSQQQLPLPAVYTGVTPCADCPGIEETLTLNTDKTFSLNRIYQERSSEPYVETGNWTVEGNKLILANPSGQQYYEIIGTNALRHLDSTGNRIETSVNLELNRIAPVGTQLRDTHWQLIELEGNPVSATFEAKRTVHIILSGQTTNVSGFSGCNRFMGHFELSGENLKFSKLAGTRMACPPSAMALEKRVLATLAAATTYKIENHALFLLNGQKTIAKFKPVNP